MNKQITPSVENEFRKTLEEVETISNIITLPLNEDLIEGITSLSEKFGVTHQRLTLGLITMAIKIIKEANNA